MSFNPLLGKTALELLKFLPAHPTVVELGNQTFTMSDEFLTQIIEGVSREKLNVHVAELQSLLGRQEKEVSAESYYRALGFQSYTAIDVNSDYGSLMMDLNRDLQADYGFHQTFDLVTNNGTGEHCFNQYAVFKNIHNLVKVSGVMWHTLPLSWINHGFYSFSPGLFADLAAANDYKILKLSFCNRNGFEIAADLDQRGNKGFSQSQISLFPPVAKEKKRKAKKPSWRSALKVFLGLSNPPPTQAKIALPDVRLTLEDCLVAIKKKTMDSPLARALERVRGPKFSNILVVAVLQKTKDEPFRTPIQGKYAKAVESEEIRKRYEIQLGVKSSEEMPGVLSKASKADVVSEPFPCLILRDVLDSRLYERLAAEFPDSEVIMNGAPEGSNKKHFYPAHEALFDQRVTPLWKKFFGFHTSPAFYRQFISVFGDSIRSLYPELEGRAGKKLEDLATGVRRIHRRADVFLDCQFAINSPVRSPSSVRGPHTDGPFTLYAGLFYFRTDSDNAGGDLELYRFKDPKFMFRPEKAVDPSHVEKFATVKYEKNTMIFFVNALYSVHAVSVRGTTNLPRRYINLVGDLTMPLYEFRRPEGSAVLTSSAEGEEEY